MKPIVLSRICFALAILVGCWILLDNDLTKAIAVTGVIVACIALIRGQP